MTKKNAVMTLILQKVMMQKIYYIRNQKVMLDSDLSELYGVKTKRLKEQVKRNIERFPERYMFELTKEETEVSRSQNATLKKGVDIEYLPFFQYLDKLLEKKKPKPRNPIEYKIPKKIMIVCMSDCVDKYRSCIKVSLGSLLGISLCLGRLLIQIDHFL
jgi:hypothetical protein